MNQHQLQGPALPTWQLWLAKMLRYLGYAWVVAVILYGFWIGFDIAVLGGEGLLLKSGYGDVYLLALVALPGLGLAKLAKHLDGRAPLDSWIDRDR